MAVHNVITPKIKPIASTDDCSYEYLLVVSSDSLYILSPDRSRFVETIIKGEDNDGYILAASSEDDFLDGIVIIKSHILAGYNPLNWILSL